MLFFEVNFRTSGIHFENLLSNSNGQGVHLTTIKLVLLVYSLGLWEIILGILIEYGILELFGNN